MAWTNITNAQLAIGAPVRSIDLLALRDNITAQANGDAGAPMQKGKTVTTGNGLSNDGTDLVVACPTHNTVGSYCMVGQRSNYLVSNPFIFGSNYSAGTGPSQLMGVHMYQGSGGAAIQGNTTLSGTWKWMSGSIISGTDEWYCGIGCRVS